MRPRETAGPWLPSVSGSLCQSQAWSCSPDTRPSALKGRAGTALAVSEECELPGLEATQRPDHRPSGLLKSVGHRCPESSSSQALGPHFPCVTSGYCDCFHSTHGETEARGILETNQGRTAGRQAVRSCNQARLAPAPTVSSLLHCHRGLTALGQYQCGSKGLVKSRSSRSPWAHC